MESRYVRTVAIAASAILGTLPAAAQAPLVDLGVATGYAINNAGQVVLSTGIYSNGTTTPLPALPGQTAPATGAAINASGQVAGSASVVVPDPMGSSIIPPGGSTGGTVAIEYSNGVLTDLLAPLTPGYGVQGFATGINSGGEIVGYSTVSSPKITDIDQPDTTGFVYANGTVDSNLPLKGNWPPTDMPQGINDNGQVTGIFSIVDPNNPLSNRLDAYVYDRGTGALTDLGEGAGTAINNAGQVTGTLDEIYVNVAGSATVTGSYAFLYSSGTTTKLGTLPGAKDGTGSAINAAGEVVGSSGGHAFFYNGAMNDLNLLISATDPLKPYVTLTSAVGINDTLLILANGVDSRTNLTHAYLYQASSLELAPAALSFTQTVGGTSVAQSVTLTNTGSAAIPIGTAYVSGNFSLRLNTCGASLAPSSQCRLAVVFVPKVVGVATGTLTIPSGGANYEVPLSGVAPITVTISPSSGTGTVGQPVTITWTASAGSTCTASSFSTNSKWTASSPPFSGTVPATGKQTLTETVNGTVTYYLGCIGPGVAPANASTSVIWSWPAVTVAISASPTTINAGQSTTLTWKSANATSCTATGGGADDSWPGTKATSGNQTVTEAVSLDTASIALTFGISCTSTVSGLSGAASVNVTEDQQLPGGALPPPASSGGGGGGALNVLSLTFLAGVLAARRARIAPPR
jgi:hypothetical protein